MLVSGIQRGFYSKTCVHLSKSLCVDLCRNQLLIFCINGVFQGLGPEASHYLCLGCIFEKIFVVHTMYGGREGD